MGTKMGPNSKCLFVGYLEEKMFAEYNCPVPDLYKRYIDVFRLSTLSTIRPSSIHLQFASRRCHVWTFCAKFWAFKCNLLRI